MSLLLRRELLRCDFDQIRRRVAALPDEGAFCGLGFQRLHRLPHGEHRGGANGLQRRAQTVRKAEGRRKIALGGEPGVFHLLALVRAGDPVSRKEARTLIDASGYPLTGFPHYDAYGAIRAILDLMDGRGGDRQALRDRVRQTPSGLPFSAAIAALAEMFIDVEYARGKAKAVASQLEKFGDHLPLVTRIFSEVLSKTAKDAAPWRKRLSALKGEKIIAFSEIVACKPSWERAFDNLAAFLDPEAAAAAAAKAAAPKAKRLAWMINIAFSNHRARRAVGQGQGMERRAGRCRSSGCTSATPSSTISPSMTGRSCAACARNRHWGYDWQLFVRRVPHASRARRPPLRVRQRRSRNAH